MDIDSKKIVDMVYCDKCGKYILQLEFEGHECKPKVIDITSNSEIIK